MRQSARPCLVKDQRHVPPSYNMCTVIGTVTDPDMRKRTVTRVAGAFFEVPGIVVLTLALVLTVLIHLNVGKDFLFRHAAYFFAERSFRCAFTSVA